MDKQHDTDELVCRAGRDRCREQTCGHGGQGEAGTHWEVRTELYTIPCVKWTASGELLYSTGSSAQCSGTTERAGMGDDAVGWEGNSRQRGYRYILRAGLHCCTAETNTTL